MNGLPMLAYQRQILRCTQRSCLLWMYSSLGQSIVGPLLSRDESDIGFVQAYSLYRGRDSGYCGKSQRFCFFQVVGTYLYSIKNKLYVARQDPVQNHVFSTPKTTVEYLKKQNNVTWVLAEASTRPTQEIIVYTLYTDRGKGQLSLGWRNLTGVWRIKDKMVALPSHI